MNLPKLNDEASLSLFVAVLAVNESVCAVPGEEAGSSMSQLSMSATSAWRAYDAPPLVSPTSRNGPTPGNT